MDKLKSKYNKLRTFQELYYDGEIDYYDERDVSPEMKKGINDCIKYIEEESDYDLLWYKNEAQKKYYREPFKAKQVVEVH
ncbi:hypothetical protein [Paenibacillus sp. ISL-20]|uniref:hypothetical protein n=1 Tax=Paenibacillus sp. ISL-20 TaxID=2819163 RepID=UPI001BEBF02A|nr:hypothetical protein [Paenibacillus sp. ISL-20]MBT2759867.1 hypothetical protein [Paenibacillus sp. ISL-20]